MTGPHKNRWDPASPKANPHWARLYAAKRRALDVSLLREAERAIAAEEATQRPPMGRKTHPHLSDEARAAIARAFGRPVAKPPS